MKTFTRCLLSMLAAYTCLAATGQAQTEQVGKPFPLSSLVFVDTVPELKGKPAIIEFWATYCVPCVKLIPHLNALHGKYKGQGLVVVGVSQDFIKGDIAKFRVKTPIDYPVAFDEDMKLGAQMGIDAIPWAFVVDRSGKIVWEGLSATLTDETVEKALK